MSERTGKPRWVPATAHLIMAGGGLTQLGGSMDPPVSAQYIGRVFAGRDKFTERVYDAMVELYGEQTAAQVRALADVSRRECFDDGKAKGAHPDKVRMRGEQIATQRKERLERAVSETRKAYEAALARAAKAGDGS